MGSHNIFLFSLYTRFRLIFILSFKENVIRATKYSQFMLVTLGLFYLSFCSKNFSHFYIAGAHIKGYKNPISFTKFLEI